MEVIIGVIGRPYSDSHYCYFRLFRGPHRIANCCAVGATYKHNVKLIWCYWSNNASYDIMGFFNKRSYISQIIF